MTETIITILLDDLAEALDRSPMDPVPVLDLTTGEVVLLEDEDEDEVEGLEVARARYVLLPRVDGHEVFEWMEAFVAAIEDEHVQRRLADALSGRGAFSRFRSVLRDYPELNDRWFATRLEHLVEEATAWLSREEISYVPKRRRVEPVP